MSSPPLKQYGEARVAAGERLLVIDLAACSGMDSTFMGTLAGLANKIVKANGGQLHVASPGDRNRHSLEDLGLAELLEIDPPGAPWATCIEQARAALAPLGQPPALTERQRAEQVLEAHRTLSDANEPNARKFAGVLQVLEAELVPKPGNA